jgi:hypothetical protein
MAAFINVGSARLRRAWALVQAGPADVLVYDDEPSTVPGWLEAPRLSLQIVAERRPGDGPEKLLRPIQFDAFIDGLCAAEQALGSHPNPPAPGVVPAPVPAPLAPLEPRPAAPARPMPGSLFKLRRWPSQALPAPDYRRFLKLATFLSTRSVSLAELERLANVDATTCEDFVSTLMAEDLLTVDGAMCAAVVDSSSGMMLGSAGSGVDFEIAAAGNTGVVRAKLKVMRQLGLNDVIDDILITLGKHYHIIRPMSRKEGVFIYFVLDKSRSNLALARRKAQDVERELVI